MTPWQVRECANCGSIADSRRGICEWCGVGMLLPFWVGRLDARAREDREGLVSHAHGATARQAAKRIKPRTGTQRYRVLEMVQQYGPMARDALAYHLSMNPNSLRPRVRELLDDGYIVVHDVTPDAHFEQLAVTDKGRELLR